MNHIRRSFVSLSVAVILLAIAVVVPAAIALGQDEELTLSGLAEQVTALVGRVDAIEAQLAPLTTADGICIQYTSGQIQRETTTKYFDAFDENLIASNVTLRAIRHDTEAGVSIYHFEQYFKKQTVTEAWRGCEFVGSSDWVQED